MRLSFPFKLTQTLEMIFYEIYNKVIKESKPFNFSVNTAGI